MKPKIASHEIARVAVDRVILVGVDLGHRAWPLEEDLAELARLVRTAGGQVVATVTQRLDHPDSRSYIGRGKLEELTALVIEHEATVVVFDDDLAPSQQGIVQSSIERAKILDRTALILDIFALHAKSREGRLQVELAQMEYLMPRLRGMWGHFGQAAAASGGAVGMGTRGPGETQLETDRRLARKRIGEVRRELAVVARSRDTQRQARAGSGIFRVALVGYTNAGKSTLLNALTDAGVLVQDKLFATLDATTRRLDLPQGPAITLTDTVGFIRKLPHSLVESFKSTLDEVRQADLLLHVIDASHPMANEQISAVNQVLTELGAMQTEQILVYNKADVADPDTMTQLRHRSHDALSISAREGSGLDALLERIAESAARNSRVIEVIVPYTRGELVQTAHEKGRIISEDHLAEGTHLVLQLPKVLAETFVPFEVRSESAKTLGTDS